MPRPIKTLIVEDNALDCELLLRELGRAGFEAHWQRVDGPDEFASALTADLDVIFCDYVMPRFDGLQALTLLNASGLLVPFIIVSGTIGEETAVAAMQGGATDYLLKDRLARLGPAVNNALAQKAFRVERSEVQRKLRASEQRLRHIFEGISANVMLCSCEGRILEANQAATDSAGMSREELIGRDLADQLWWVGVPAARARCVAALVSAANGETRRTVLEGVSLSGATRVLEAAFNPLRDAAGRVTDIVASGIDVTKRDEAERKIKEQLEELLRWQDVMLNREDRVQALKAEVNDQLARLGEPPRYATSPSP